jgi:hypothetical protein
MPSVEQAVSGVKDATSSLQDLAALCANADEVTSPGSPIAHGAGTKEPAGELRLNLQLLPASRRQPLL